ncbi:unnamed protein product [Ectocarpus sp. 12 AP-2014]
MRGTTSAPFPSIRSARKRAWSTVLAKARAWGRPGISRFSPTTARAFQESLWYSSLQFMTGPCHTAHGIFSVPRSDYGKPEIMRSRSPQSGGLDKLVVEETRQEDVHVDDVNPGAFLGEMKCSTTLLHKFSVRVGRRIDNDVGGRSALV